MTWKHFAHPDDLDLVVKYHQKRRIDPSSVPTVYTIRMYDRGGVLKTLHAVVALIPGTGKSIASYVDISEQKRSEEALTLANRKLNLLSSITRHDIINQLLVLKGFLALLKSKTSDPVLLDYIGRSDRATRNIDHQITFTRDYQDMGVKAPAWQNVKRTIIGAKGALPLNGVTVDMDRPDLELFADPLFEKVFFNLIDNSLKYGGNNCGRSGFPRRRRRTAWSSRTRMTGSGSRTQTRPVSLNGGSGNIPVLDSSCHAKSSRSPVSLSGKPANPVMGARFEIIVPKGAWRFAKTT